MNGKKIRPLQGEALIYVDAPVEVTEGGISIPDKFQGREKSQETITGQIRAFGIWRISKKGKLIPHPANPGDRVLLMAGSGRWLKSPNERLKLVPEDRILAVLEK